MKSRTPAPPLTLLQYFRYGVQLAIFMINVYAGFRIAYTLDLPDWAFVGTVIIAGMFFCGWCCPFGTVQEHLRDLGRLLKLHWQLPAKLDRIVVWFRYLPGLLLPAYVWNICNAQEKFYRWSSLSSQNCAGICFLIAVLVISLGMERPFCKYLCPYGAMRSLWQILRLFSIRRNRQMCINCKQCDRVCPMGIKISTASKLRDIRCINCMKCISVCPAKKALDFGLAIPGKNEFSRWNPVKRFPVAKK